LIAPRAPAAGIVMDDAGSPTRNANESAPTLPNHFSSLASKADRERQIAEKPALALTHKETARELDISPATVRNHTQSALSKLGAPNKTAMAATILRP